MTFHVARRRPKPLKAQLVNESGPTDWDGLVYQLLGSACRTPYNLAQRRLNALHLAAAALRQADEIAMAEHAMALACEVIMPPRD